MLGNLVDHGHDSLTAVQAPRAFPTGAEILVEPGIPAPTVTALQALEPIGSAQLITIDDGSGTAQRRGGPAPRRVRDRLVRPTPVAARPEAPEAAPWAPLGPTVLVTVIASFFVVGQLHMVIPLSHAMARDWHASTASVTWVATLFSLTYAVGQLVFGPLSDRLGRRAVMTFGLLAMAAVTAAIGTAGSLAAGLALRGVQGFGAASFAVVALAYVAERVEPGGRAIAMTALTSSFFAAAIVGQVVAQAIEALLGWRAVFWGSAAVLVAVALCLRAVLLPDAVSTRTSLGTTMRVMGALVLDRRVALCTFFLLLGASAGPQLVSLLHGRSFDTLLLALVGMFLGAAGLVAVADRGAADGSRGAA